MFKTLINIDQDFFKQIEKYFSITVDKEIIEKIFKDAEEDQVSEKEYKIYNGKKRFFGPGIEIAGEVDHYEPYDIWIISQNMKEKDLKHLKELIED